MKTITLTQGKVTLVDDDVYEWASKFSWSAHYSGQQRFYARRATSVKLGKVRKIYLHRDILQPDKNLQVDHINGNTLDNRKENLRVVTNQQNHMAFQKLPKIKTTSKFRGVYWETRGQQWAAHLMKNKKGIFLGYFDSEEVAARAYDSAAITHFGEYATLNFSVI